MTVLITTVLNTTISQGTAAESNNAQHASTNPTTATLRRSKADEIARRLSEATPRRCRNASCSRHNRPRLPSQYFPWDGRGEKRRGKKRSVGQSGLHRRVGGAWVNPNRTKNKIYVCVWGGVGERDWKGGGREENSRRREHFDMGCGEGVGLAVIRQRRVAGRKNDVPAVPNRRLRMRNTTSLTLVSQPLRTSHFSQTRRQIRQGEGAGPNSSHLSQVDAASSI